jgi:2-dehydropantoate 2-reductase
MRIAVFGTGGVGGYFGGRLAQAGEEVIFISRGEHLNAIQQNGLRVDSIKGDFIVQPARATDKPSQVGIVDVILVSVKAWHVPQAAQAMLPMIGEETVVVPLENGVEAPQQLSIVLGKEHVLGGLCQISSFIAGPGHIKHVAIEPFVAFGELDGRASERVDKLRLAFDRAGVKVEASVDIQAAMWRKFVFITSISGVNAVTRAPAGVLRSLPPLRQMLENALNEVTAVAQAHGVGLPEDTAARTLTFIDGFPEGTVASMARDIIEGRPSELEAQNGAVVRLGREVGIPTPTHAMIYASLLPQELKARGDLDY